MAIHAESSDLENALKNLTIKAVKPSDFKEMAKYMLNNHEKTSIGKNALKSLQTVLNTKKHKVREGQEIIAWVYSKHFYDGYHRPRLSNAVRQKRHNKTHKKRNSARKAILAKCEEIGLSIEGLKELEDQMRVYKCGCADEYLLSYE